MGTGPAPVDPSDPLRLFALVLANLAIFLVVVVSVYRVVHDWRRQHRRRVRQLRLNPPVQRRAEWARVDDVGGVDLLLQGELREPAKPSTAG